ncbi:hypothetical protein F5Y17DRAFT_149481 [Xylariaceae sp. FL0594]|nr:hypothetical protein F5Y17DRAFT_149481 [Xylariaceae sp. FL0594]
MRHTTTLLSPARALHRVLLHELSSSSTSSSSFSITTAAAATTTITNASSSSSLRTCRMTAKKTPPCNIHIRTFAKRAEADAADAPRVIIIRGGGGGAGDKKKKKNDGSGVGARNHEIPYTFVRLRLEDGTLSGPQRRDAVIDDLPAGHDLVMLAPPPPPSSKSTPMAATIPAAICRIVDRKAKAEKQQQEEEEEAAGAPQTKCLEISWSIADNDLARKLQRLAQFLNKGFRVEVQLARKKGQGKKKTPAASADECAALVNRIRAAAFRADTVEVEEESLEEGEGEEEVEVSSRKYPPTRIREFKQPSGYPGQKMFLYFEGPQDRIKKKSAKKNKYESKIPEDFVPRIPGQPRPRTTAAATAAPPSSSRLGGLTFRKY